MYMHDYDIERNTRINPKNEFSKRNALHHPPNLLVWIPLMVLDLPKPRLASEWLFCTYM